MGKTSAFIGPIVSSAIIDADTTATKAGNNSLPFYFLFGLSLLSGAVLFFLVDLKKSRVEQAAFLEEERLIKERRASLVSVPPHSAFGPDTNTPELHNVDKKEIKA